MGSISNKFIVTALQDGQTVTGSMSVSRSLWQAINKNTGDVMPNWYNASVPLDSSTRPCLTPVLMSGGTQITNTTINWKYNGVAMTFNNQNGTNDAPAAVAGKFYKKELSLFIVDNIASITNDDSDVITAYGTATVGDSQLSWECAETIRITEAGSSSTIGELVFTQQGKSYLISDSDSLTIQALLHDNTGDVAMTDYQVKWYLNNSSTVWQTTTNTESHTVTLTGDDQSGVLDNTAVTAYFFKKKSDNTGYETDSCAMAIAFVDDLSDEEVMQFAYAVHQASVSPTQTFLNNTTAATIKTGQAVTYGIWIGKKTDPTDEITGWTFTITFYKANQDTVSGIGTPVTGSFNVAADGSTSVTITGGIRSTLTYQNVVDNGGTVTGIVTATKSTSSD